MSTDHSPIPAQLLEASIQDLTRRQELLTREYEANAALLTEALAASTDVEGVAEAADGAIVATVDASHRLVDLVLEPPALRLGSIQRLRDELVKAVNAAIDDVDDQLQAAGGRTEAGDAVAGFLDQMPEVTALIPDALVASLRNPAKPEPRPAHPKIDAPDWNLDA